MMDVKNFGDQKLDSHPKRNKMKPNRISQEYSFYLSWKKTLTSDHKYNNLIGWDLLMSGLGYVYHLSKDFSTNKSTWPPDILVITQLPCWKKNPSSVADKWNLLNVVSKFYLHQKMRRTYLHLLESLDVKIWWCNHRFISVHWKCACCPFKL